MKPLSEATVDHLRLVLDWPDLSGTKYELLEKIGEGGMASVYLAHDRELDRHVALKVTHAENADPGIEACMKHEAQILARLEHPSIVPIHDTGVLPDGRRYFAMKRVNGRQLDEFARTDASESARLLLFAKICEAVQFAHNQRFIHRDLKPGNIMVGPFGEVLVMDWGVAKQIATCDDVSASGSAAPHPGSGATEPGTVVGTPGFMSPEQERGALDEVDERTDVFALGAILRVLLAKQTGEMLHRETAPLPPALAAICDRAQAYDRGGRYPSVAALADDVMRYLSGLRVRAYREGMWGTAKRLVARNRVALGLVVAYMVMRLVLLLVARL